MNNVLFRRGDQTFIDENVPLNDGQIIFNETDEAIYLDVTIDNNVVRKRYGGGNLSRSDIDMAFSTTSENPIANKVVTNAIGSLSSLQTDVKTNLVSAINEVNTKVSKTEDLISNSGDAYSPSRPYKVGNLCIYNNTLYRCITACSAGSWTTNQSCFTQDTMVNVTSGLSSSKYKQLINIGNPSESTTITFPMENYHVFEILFYVSRVGSANRRSVIFTVNDITVGSRFPFAGASDNFMSYIRLLSYANETLSFQSDATILPYQVWGLG